MFRSSIPLGRFFGVEVRVHISFVLLLVAAVVREIARAIAALYSGLHLRAVLLLPVGGVMAFAPREHGAPRTSMRLVTAAAPIANFGMGLLLLGFSYGLEPKAALFAQPWISLHHILRSTVWLQFLVGAVNLLPAAAMPTRRILRTRQSSPTPALRVINPAMGLNIGLAIVLMLAGFVLA